MPGRLRGESGRKKADKNTGKRLIYPLEPAAVAAQRRLTGESGREKADKNTGKRLVYPLEPVADAAPAGGEGKAAGKKQIKTQESVWLICWSRRRTRRRGG